MTHYALTYQLNGAMIHDTFEEGPPDAVTVFMIGEGADSAAIDHAEMILAGNEFGRILPIVGGAVLTDRDSGEVIARFDDDLTVVWSRHFEKEGK